MSGRMCSLPVFPFSIQTHFNSTEENLRSAHGEHQALKHLILGKESEIKTLREEMDEMNGTIDSLKDAVDKEKQSSDKLVKKISATQVIIAISGLFIDLMKTISVNTEFICRND